ncbi:hypothetical protein [Azospirillum isscasi]|uniref:Uncharacterized protein n=1 Tax=Azospirillum isscasi TaxID=3053926 RepID=A0ABU0WCQ8_9PROT|nr:hypothetical protein [Azospirillum isscasi]MDQ2101973.1 hypothetical protein [Azospirillum isscasi]
MTVNLLIAKVSVVIGLGCVMLPQCARKGRIAKEIAGFFVKKAGNGLIFHNFKASPQ